MADVTSLSFYQLHHINMHLQSSLYLYHFTKLMLHLSRFQGHHFAIIIYGITSLLLYMKVTDFFLEIFQLILESLIFILF